MQAQPQDKPQPLIEHLRELRTRILRCVLIVFILAIVLTPIAPELYTLIARPLLSLMPQGGSMIAVEVASPFLTPFKLVLVSALFLSMPLLLYQAWAFLAPGMYRHEKRFALSLLLGASFLFYSGVLFAWYAVMPLAFAFFNSVTPEGVSVMTDIRHYLNFVLKTMFAFGLAFQIPIAVIVAVRTKLISRRRLAHIRPHIIVFCFFIGMVLTPPDVVSQILLAVPAWLLFELGLLVSRVYERREDKDRAV
jgi:sec-independent protein translocase protein TatC